MKTMPKYCNTTVKAQFAANFFSSHLIITSSNLHTSYLNGHTFYLLCKTPPRSWKVSAIKHHLFANGRMQNIIFHSTTTEYQTLHFWSCLKAFLKSICEGWKIICRKVKIKLKLPFLNLPSFEWMCHSVFH